MTFVETNQNPLLAPAGETAGETPVNTGSSLRMQAHGGALLTGGKPGNRGGGRPKESLRQRMRELLDATLDAMTRALAGERSAAESLRAILDDPRIIVLESEVRQVVADVCQDHITTKLTAREIGQFHETLARYGVGTQQEIESTERQVRYVIRLPARPHREPKAVAIVAAATERCDGQSTSHARATRNPALPELHDDAVR